MNSFLGSNGAIARYLALGALMVLTACGTAQDTVSRADGIHDPYEPTNRRIHAFNKALDTNLLRPGSKRYARFVPVEFRTSISNVSENFSMPSVAVNSLLQGDLRSFGLSTARFAVNSTLGIGGIIDVYSEFGVEEVDTDFGETLYVWGVGEGTYVELPVFGPSTRRDALGRVVDIVTNPLSNTLDSPEKYYGTAAAYLTRLNDRDRFSSTIDSILYDSADSYAQARLIYLQNRRFELGDETASSGSDPYTDPYEDPYAQ
ncbi:VacJ family lipoprotein [Sulfitobacter sabulilitoris]